MPDDQRSERMPTAQPGGPGGMPGPTPPPSATHRNQPCACGSGKRYKHCHGAATSSAAPTAARPMALRPDPLQTLHQALAQQQHGHLAAAEALYEQALTALPDHFDALHMLGVVKLQLGKFAEATRLLVTGAPLVPAGAQGNFQHNLGLCLMGHARERGILETLSADPAPLDPPAPFARAYALPGSATDAAGRVSVILTEVATMPALLRSLAGIRAQDIPDLEILAAIPPGTPGREALQAALDACGMPARLLIAADARSPAAAVNLAVDAATGTKLAFLRAGDRWTPQWARRMTAALDGFGAQWGYGGLRAVEWNDTREGDPGTIVRFGASPALDALLRAQDGLYTHRTGSLAFLAFNPVAGGRSLMIRRELWQRLGGLDPNAAEPFHDWGRRAAWNDEPAYLDEPDTLIPAATAALHAMAAGADPLPDAGPGWSRARNPHLRHGLALLRAREWRMVCALQAATMPLKALLACAGSLDIAPAAATAPDVRRAA